ncbi:unnamed protein product [Spirodela intermedia]|uniref:Uncharacterized protein n=1 Tax=Spirodela intermedia TaxID=51605 RepID=A0A7I8KJ06_SPIIN|nr:unnamed protein product [Spirodela intermedia]
MAKRRKSVASRLDEVDRTIYSSFCNAANSLSQIYTQAMNQQKIAFQAGERHGVEKIQSWISRRLEEGSTPTIADLLGYLQNELEHGGDEASTMSPRSQSQLANSTHLDQAKGPIIFSGAFPCPPRRSLAVEPPAGGFFPGGAAFVSGDTAMDTHSDGPSQDLY